MPTTSALEVLRVIRTRFLTFDGALVQTALGVTDSGAGSDGRLYIDQAPDNVVNPPDGKTRYGVMRLLDWREEGDDGGFARRVQLEVHLTGRPRSQAGTIKAAADAIERSVRGWVDTSAGVIVAQRGLTRATVLYEAPADREVVLERLLIPLYVHAQYHTQDSA